MSRRRCNLIKSILVVLLRLREGLHTHRRRVAYLSRRQTRRGNSKSDASTRYRACHFAPRDPT